MLGQQHFYFDCCCLLGDLLGSLFGNLKLAEVALPDSGLLLTLPPPPNFEEKEDTPLDLVVDTFSEFADLTTMLEEEGCLA